MANQKSITNYRLTDHAKAEMVRRKISPEEVAKVLAAPGQIEVVRPGREVWQSGIKAGQSPREYLLRVFIDVDRNPPEVVTAYRTSKIAKYWRVKT